MTLEDCKLILHQKRHTLQQQQSLLTLALDTNLYIKSSNLPRSLQHTQHCNIASFQQCVTNTPSATPAATFGLKKKATESSAIAGERSRGTLNVEPSDSITDRCRRNAWDVSKKLRNSGRKRETRRESCGGIELILWRSR